MMMVGSGTTTMWRGVMFVPNLLLLLFFTEHMRTQHPDEKPFVCNEPGCGFKTAYGYALQRK